MREVRSWLCRRNRDERQRAVDSLGEPGRHHNHEEGDTNASSDYASDCHPTTLLFRDSLLPLPVELGQSQWAEDDSTEGEGCQTKQGRDTHHECRDRKPIGAWWPDRGLLARPGPSTVGARWCSRRDLMSAIRALCESHPITIVLGPQRLRIEDRPLARTVDEVLRLLGTR